MWKGEFVGGGGRQLWEPRTSSPQSLSVRESPVVLLFLPGCPVGKWLSWSRVFVCAHTETHKHTQKRTKTTANTSQEKKSSIFKDSDSIFKVRLLQFNPTFDGEADTLVLPVHPRTSKPCLNIYILQETIPSNTLFIETEFTDPCCHIWPSRDLIKALQVLTAFLFLRSGQFWGRVCATLKT